MCLFRAQKLELCCHGRSIAMKTICAALSLVAMSGETMGYDYNRSLGNEWGQRRETAGLKKPHGSGNSSIRKECSGLNTSNKCSSKKTNAGKDRLRQRNAALGYGDNKCGARFEQCERAPLNAVKHPALFRVVWHQKIPHWFRQPPGLAYLFQLPVFLRDVRLVFSLP